MAKGDPHDYEQWRSELLAAVPEREPLPPDPLAGIRERIRTYEDEWEARRDEEYRKRTGGRW